MKVAGRGGGNGGRKVGENFLWTISKENCGYLMIVFMWNGGKIA
jgi:hypothetical protein